MAKRIGEFERGCRDFLLEVAEAYAAATGLSLSTIGRKFHGSQAFFRKLKDGKASVTVPKVDEMLEGFGRSWPAGVARPRLGIVRMRVGKTIPGR